MSAFTLEERDGVLALRFDLPGEKVNLLTAATLDELEARLDEAARRTGARALLLESGKPGSFVAGADVRAIAAIQDAAGGEAAARRGQAVFAKIAALPMPTVALIHGACVGGGLELALACRHRVASDDPATKLGLPEVQLGILPGFGGTQRLPARVGLLAALPLLLTGRRTSARAAKRIGLVDEIAAPQRLREAALRVIGAEEPSGPRGFARAFEIAVRTLPPLRRFVLERARRDVLARSGGLFPAPLRILDAAAAGYDSGGEHGYAEEARLLGELLAGPVARSLLRIFLLSESAPGDREAARGVSRAFVAGAGQMGCGIAALLAGAGVRTRLHDADLAALARGLSRSREKLGRRLREDRREQRAACDRIDPSAGLHGLATCDLALEAIVEDLEAKRRLLRELEARLPERALIATNTSSLDLDRLADGLARPDRLVGLHFFHPVESMRLVEVVRGAASSESAVALGCALARRLGKVPVIVANRPGFLVNRLLAPCLLEAERLVQEGAGVAEVDEALREAGLPMGPLELLDEVGLDVAMRVGEVLREAFPERPHAFAEVGLVRRLVSAGSLGKKSGRGFYRYGRRRRPDPELPRPGAGAADEWTDRLLLLVVAEAWRCLAERVVESEDRLDLAMALGAGFLVAQGGPTRYARARGLSEVVARLDQLEARHGPRFEAPEALRAAAR